MNVSYEQIVSAFLNKINEYELLELADDERDDSVFSFLTKSLYKFNRVCNYKLEAVRLEDGSFELVGKDMPEEEMDEALDILTNGMVVQWLKPFLNRQENLENALSTRDFTVFSPANLLLRVRETYNNAKRDFENELREYSFSHNDLNKLHLPR